MLLVSLLANSTFLVAPKKVVHVALVLSLPATHFRLEEPDKARNLRTKGILFSVNLFTNFLLGIVMLLCQFLLDISYKQKCYIYIHLFRLNYVDTVSAFLPFEITCRFVFQISATVCRNVACIEKTYFFVRCRFATCYKMGYCCLFNFFFFFQVKISDTLISTVHKFLHKGLRVAITFFFPAQVSVSKAPGRGSTP